MDQSCQPVLYYAVIVLLFYTKWIPLGRAVAWWQVQPFCD